MISEKDQSNVSLAYVYGNGRSGTTLFTGLLDFCDDYIGVGELNRGFNNLNGDCSCGQVVCKCVFWKPVIGNIEKQTSIPSQDLFKTVTDLERKHYFLLWVVGLRKKKYEKYKRVNLELVSSIQNQSNGKIPVDSSKNIMRLLLLRRFINKIRIYHIIRNPRAVYYSNTKVYVRRKYNQKKGLLKYRSIYLAYVLISWNITNFFGLFFKGNTGYDVTKYEELAIEPLNVLKKKNINLNQKENAGQSADNFHLIYGNRMLKSFDISDIKADEEWKKQMKWYHEILVQILTFPTIWIYGYGRNK